MSGLPVDADLNGASYQIIRYLTVDDVFDPETTYAGLEGISLANTTRLIFYNNRLDEPDFEELHLVGTNVTNSIWTDGISSDVSGNPLDLGSTRLDPAGGNFIHPKISGNEAAPSVTPLTQPAAGMIACHAQAVALNEGFNMVGAIYPFDQTPAGPNGRDYTVDAGLLGGINPGSISELLFWKGDASADVPGTPYTETYGNFFLLNDGNTQQWVDSSDRVLTNLNDVLILESHRAVLLELEEGNVLESHLYPLPDFGLED